MVKRLQYLINGLKGHTTYLLWMNKNGHLYEQLIVFQSMTLI